MNEYYKTARENIAVKNINTNSNKNHEEDGNLEKI